MSRYSYVRRESRPRRDATRSRRGAPQPLASPSKLFLTDVLHKAFVRVDEEGTDAAAATAVVAGTTSIPQIDVRLAVDRPFVLAVRDRTTGVLLFLGRVVDPR